MIQHYKHRDSLCTSYCHSRELLSASSLFWKGASKQSSCPIHRYFSHHDCNCIKTRACDPGGGVGANTMLASIAGGTTIRAASRGSTTIATCRPARPPSSSFCCWVCLTCEISMKQNLNELNQTNASYSRNVCNAASCCHRPMRCSPGPTTASWRWSAPCCPAAATSLIVAWASATLMTCSTRRSAATLNATDKLTRARRVDNGDATRARGQPASPTCNGDTCVWINTKRFKFN